LRARFGGARSAGQIRQNPTAQGRQIMMMDRRTFSAAVVVGAAASLISTRGMAANPATTKARNVVLVHGLFADGSCWSEVIARLRGSMPQPFKTL
jgi:hypothetical protein